MRARREREFAAKPAKSSRGSTEGRASPDACGSNHTGMKPVSKTAPKAGVSTNPTAGIKPGPCETKPKVGRPRIEDKDKTLAALKPWAVLGMSESTWRRRQAEKAKKNS
jgi:hypothetical protein